MFVFLVMVALAGCGISRQQEIAIGRDAREQFEEEFGGLYADSQIQGYVHRVGMELARHSGREGLPWEFRVLNSDQVNAFALPGGLVYITRGLLFNLENEAQLAAVLGHEIGHVAERHSVEQLQRAQLLQGGSMLAGLLGQEQPAIADIGQLVAGLAMMKYGREQEREADLAGLEYLARSGLSPSAMLNVIDVLRRSSAGAGPPEFLSSHPSAESREEYLRREIREDYSGTVNGWELGRDEFVRNVLSRRYRVAYGSPRRTSPRSQQGPESELLFVSAGREPGGIQRRPALVRVKTKGEFR